MRRKLVFINIVLLVLVVLVAVLVRSEWRQYRRSNDVTKIRAAAGPKSIQAAQSSASTPPLPQAGVFNVIFERNLFSPNRSEFEPPEPPPPEAPKTPVMPGKVTLLGVTVIGEKKIAFIQEPQTNAPPQNRSVQVGDSVMGFGKVSEIRPDALAFTWGDVVETVQLFDGDSGPRAKAAAAQVLQTNVVSIAGGKGGKKGATIAPAPPGTPGAAPSIQIATVGGAGLGATGIQGRGTNTMRPGQQGGVGGNAGSINPGLQQPALQNPQNQGYTQTPFGRIPTRTPPRRQ
jgi:hypothetical protein